MGEPITEASDETLSISYAPHPLMDVPTRLVIDMTEGRISANAVATYLVARVRSEHRLRTSNGRIAELRRISPEQLEKHLVQLKDAGWLTFNDEGFHVNDVPFQKPEDCEPSLREFLEAKLAEREART